MSPRRALVLVLLALVPLGLASPSVQADDPVPAPRLADPGSRVEVQLTAHREAYGDDAASAPPVRGRRAVLVREDRPVVTGTRRYLRTLTASPGQWEQRVERRYRWLRDGRPITGATGRSYRLTHRDVGRRVRVEVTATRPGHRSDSWRSARPRPIRHRVALRRTVPYRVETRGRLTTSLADFERLARATLVDPRGWRGAGVGFRRVQSGGAMSLVLSEASEVPGFDPVCSSTWSCRVGRYVVINQERWKHASPAWNRHGGSLRGYRHMVVNHETGHWLGNGHRGCPAPGAAAPVMQQQSISLGGCRVNPFPLPSERATPSLP